MNMRPSKVNGQTARSVSYMDEIDDDNVLQALRNLHQRRSKRNAAAVGTQPPPVAPASIATVRSPPQHNKRKNSGTNRNLGDNDGVHMEEKKDTEDTAEDYHREEVVEKRGFWKGVRVPLDNLDRVQPEDLTLDETEATTITYVNETGLERIFNVLTCSASACDRFLVGHDAFQQRWGACVCESDEQIPVHQRMQMLSQNSRNAKPIAGIDDEETFETDDLTAIDYDDPDLTEEQAEKLKEFNKGKVIPALELIRDVNAFLFRGEYEVLQLHSISRMLNRMEYKLERSLESMRGVDEGRVIKKVSFSGQNDADVKHLALKIEKVYGLVLEASEEYVAQRILIEGSKIDDLVASDDGSGTWEEESTFDDTFEDSMSVDSYVGKNEEGESSMLPAVASFINLTKSFQSSEKSPLPDAAANPPASKTNSSQDDTDQDTLAQILDANPSRDEDDQSAMTWWTYTFDAVDKDITEQVEHLRAGRPLPRNLPRPVQEETIPSLPSDEQSTTFRIVHQVQPGDDIENQSVELSAASPSRSLKKGISSGNKKPPLQAKVENKKGERKLMKKFSKVFNRGKSLSSRSPSPSPRSKPPRDESSSIPSTPPRSVRSASSRSSPSGLPPSRPSPARSLSDLWMRRRRSTASSKSAETGFHSNETPQVNNLVLTRTEWRQRLNDAVDRASVGGSSQRRKAGGSTTRKDGSSQTGHQQELKEEENIDWAPAVGDNPNPTPAITKNVSWGGVSSAKSRASDTKLSVKSEGVPNNLVVPTMSDRVSVLSLGS